MSLIISSPSISSFSKSLAVLSGTEENSGLSAAIAQMSSVQEKVAYIHNDQASAEFFQLSELIKDYVGLIGAVKDIMQVNNSWSCFTKQQTKKRGSIFTFCRHSP